MKDGSVGWFLLTVFDKKGLAMRGRIIAPFWVKAPLLESASLKCWRGGQW